MAKTLIVNNLGGKNQHFALPANDTNAKAFCDAVLDGEYTGYALQSESGSDTGVTGYNLARIQIADEITGIKTYFSIAVKSTVSDVDLQTAVKGKTFNGVKADQVFVSMKKVKLS